MKKRIIAAILCLVMLMSVMPVSASATSAAWDGTTIDVSWYNTTDTEFYISTPEQLMGLAAIVNGIYNKSVTKVIGDKSVIVDNVVESEDSGGGSNLSSSVYHFGADNFSGKTVYITADLDMGGSQSASGVWRGPNYMPIGGQYLMEQDDSSTKLGSSFCGMLDGQGHYIRNIYCSRRCTTGNYGDGQSVGLVGRLGVHDNEVSTAPATAAVRNLAVTGYIYANRSVGGIVGKIGKTADGAVIENCANFATVRNTDAKGVGGIVGAGWNGGVVRNCYNAGAVSSTYTCPTGGISGSNEITIENCYNIGKISAAKDSYAMAIGTNNGGGNNVTNCYWLTDTAPGGGYYGSNKVTVTKLSETEMKAAASKLGSAFAEDTAGINSGYPILQWQVTTRFTDVSSTAWYYDAVEYVAEQGLFNGTGNGAFTPDGTMTRAMFATVLHRYYDTPMPTAAIPFSDVPSGKWYSDAIAWAAEQGHLKGTGNNKFSPNKDITLQEMLLVLYRCVGSPSVTASLTGSLASTSSWATDAVAWASSTGILNNVGGTLNPTGSATRAQVAQILMNFNER